MLFIFELNDTEGAPVPVRDQNPLFAQGIVKEELFPRTIKAAMNFSVEVMETDHYGDNLAGTAAGLRICPERVIIENKSAFRIRLNAKHDIPTKFATLAHELSHIYCGHLGADAQGRWP